MSTTDREKLVGLPWLVEGETLDRALRAVVDRGVATPEHTAIVAKLAEAARGGRA